MLQQIFPGYEIVYRSAKPPAKTSYSGTMVLYRHKFQPIVTYPRLKAPIPLDQQGRIITLSLPNFYLINCYQPHYEYHNLPLHQQWMQKITQYFQELATQKPLIIAGDFAVLPPAEADLTKAPVEFQNLLASGLVDTFAIPNYANLTPSLGATWWPPNIPKTQSLGWRLDFWLVSNRLKNKIKDTQVIDTGARLDHAPIMLYLQQ